MTKTPPWLLKLSPPLRPSIIQGGWVRLSLSCVKASVAMNTLVSHQILPLGPNPIRISLLAPLPHNVHPLSKTPPNPIGLLRAAKSQLTHLSDSRSKPPASSPSPPEAGGSGDDGGIPADHVKTLVKFKSRYNYIRVLEVSRRADHPFAGSRLLLLDAPGNIHSISFLLKVLTTTYFDVFATFPPILPPGPIGILGFGAGSAARLIFHLYPDAEIHGWELDPSVISVGREYFGMVKLEKQNPDKLFIYVGDALQAEVGGGFSGILVDLFSKGSLISELQDPRTWKKLKRSLRRGGRIMVNCGGSCVEAEDPRRDGKLVMEETLRAMDEVFRGELFVLNLAHRREDSSLALTGNLPDPGAWRRALPSALRCYVDMWAPFNG